MIGLQRDSSGRFLKGETGADGVEVQASEVSAGECSKHAQQADDVAQKPTAVRRGRAKKKALKRKTKAKTAKTEAESVEQSAELSDEQLKIVEDLERGLEFKLRKGNVLDLHRFLQRAKADPTGELLQREGRILANMLRQAYKGSAPHAKLCLDWGKAGSKKASESKESDVSVEQVLLERLGLSGDIVTGSEA